MPGYETRIQSVAVAGGANLEIRSLLDRQQFFDPHGEAEKQGISSASWSLFGQVWPSAQKLADLMQVRRMSPGRTLEIGCGLALASMVVHRRGGDITASDCHPMVQSFLQDNLSRNCLPVMKYQNGNWRQANPALGVFEQIIGSDVLYERNHPGQLAAFIDAHAALTSEILIVDPNRGNRSAFTREMDRFGFALGESKIESPLADGSRYRGRLLRFTRT